MEPAWDHLSTDGLGMFALYENLETERHYGHTTLSTRPGPPAYVTLRLYEAGERMEEVVRTPTK